jgi:predicted nucleotidyltransferase
MDLRKSKEALNAQQEYQRMPQGSKMEQLVAYLVKQGDVLAAYLFGSQVTGKIRPDSDIDLSLLLSESDKMERFERRLQMMHEISRICGVEADVIILNDAPLVLVHQILKTGQLFYEIDRRARVTFEVRAGKDYADLKPFREFFRRGILKEIKEKTSID